MVFRFRRFEFDKIMFPGGRMGSHCDVKFLQRLTRVDFYSFFFIFKNHYPRKVETYVEASTDSVDLILFKS